MMVAHGNAMPCAAVSGMLIMVASALQGTCSHAEAASICSRLISCHWAVLLPALIKRSSVEMLPLRCHIARVHALPIVIATASSVAILPLYTRGSTLFLLN